MRGFGGTSRRSSKPLQKGPFGPFHCYSMTCDSTALGHAVEFLFALMRKLLAGEASCTVMGLLQGARSQEGCTHVKIAAMANFERARRSSCWKHL